jgi:t-SNARE complex subunit (syntaxin)
MSDELSKQLFELHIKSINTSIEKMDNSIIKIFERQDQMNVTLAKNTVVVREHHLRSTRLENITEEMLQTIQNISTELSKVKLEVKRLDNDVKPIKEHVGNLDKSVTFITNLPKAVKLIGGLILAVVFIVGLVNGTATLGDLLGLIKIK